MNFRNVVVPIVVVLCLGRIALPQTVAIEGTRRKPSAVVVKNAAGKIVASIPLSHGDRAVATVRSLDKKLIFVVVAKHGGSGVLDIVDLVGGTTTNRALIDHPTRVIRLGSKRGLWVMNRQEMLSLSETGELGNQPILLWGHGYPGETISLGEDHAAILLNSGIGPVFTPAGWGGNSLHRVALLDLKQLKLEGVVKTRSVGKHMKAATRDLAKNTLRSVATLGNLYFDTVYPNEFLAARPDGRFLYTLDTESREVTVIDAQTATIVTRISVNKFASKLQVSSDGKDLLCMGKRVQTADRLGSEFTVDRFRVEEDGKLTRITVPEKPSPRD